MIADSHLHIALAPAANSAQNSPASAYAARRSPQRHRKEATPQDARAILQPLENVFLQHELLDEIVQRVSIPELLGGQQPAYAGVILFGPPGTGKTILLRELAKVYANAGAWSGEVSASAINSSYVGEFARRLEKWFKQALLEAERRQKPSFLWFDEASILVQNPDDGADSVAKHYLEAMDVMKRYIGNYRQLVVAISTNVWPDSYEPALVREGRLSMVGVGYPQASERSRMFKHFLRHHVALDIGDEVARQLADATPEEQGAFIEEFCRNWVGMRRSAMLREQGHESVLGALRAGAVVDEATMRSSLTVSQLLQDLRAAIELNNLRLTGERTPQVQRIGF